MIIDDPNRYCNQIYIVQCLRWWRHKPLAYCYAFFDTLRWIVSGMPKVTFGDEWPIKYSRWETCKSLWEARNSMASFKMGAFLTSQEWIAELRGQSNIKQEENINVI